MNYDLWKSGQYDDHDREHKCTLCNDKQETLDDCANLVQEIITQIYSRDDDLNTRKLDKCFEDLSYHLDIRPAIGYPQVMRKRNPIYLLSDLIQQQEDSEFLKSLAK